MPTISIRLNDVEMKVLKKIQEQMQENSGKGIRLNQSDVIRYCINEYYYNLTK